MNVIRMYTDGDIRGDIFEALSGREMWIDHHMIVVSSDEQFWTDLTNILAALEGTKMENCFLDIMNCSPDRGIEMECGNYNITIKKIANRDYTVEEVEEAYDVMRTIGQNIY